MDEKDLINEFAIRIGSEGIVASTVSDGVVIGITKEKLQELLDIASSNPDGKTIIFIKRETTSQTFN